MQPVLGLIEQPHFIDRFGRLAGEGKDDDAVALVESVGRQAESRIRLPGKNRRVKQGQDDARCDGHTHRLQEGDVGKCKQAKTGDGGLMLLEYAPVGVIGALTPITNPTGTIINNSISMVAASGCK